MLVIVANHQWHKETINKKNFDTVLKDVEPFLLDPKQARFFE